MCFKPEWNIIKTNKMKTYYIYHVPGVKIGATKDWDARSQYNFNHYGVEPIIVETMEGPDNEDMWQIVGDREWELADQNGYERGEHYRAAILKRIQGGIKGGNKTKSSGQWESISKLGRSISAEKAVKAGEWDRRRKNGVRKAALLKRVLTMDQAREIRKLAEEGVKYDELCKRFDTNKPKISRIVNNKLYLE